MDTGRIDQDTLGFEGPVCFHQPRRLPPLRQRLVPPSENAAWLGLTEHLGQVLGQSGRTDAWPGLKRFLSQEENRRSQETH